ncbi:hypothetical protein [Enterococcus crotali]|uniref:hypothetical protein n=1 Tax=Enterococcus crotali TaxID=1453587 RepID=UPI000472C49A|nr:hypothetical protein [Enterococcus crotali]
MYNERNFDVENGKSLVAEETSSTEHCAIPKSIFHKNNRDLIKDILGGYGPNAFGGHGVVKHARVENTTNLFGESVHLLILTLKISDIYPSHSFDYYIDYPMEVNVSSESSFLELLERIQENNSYVSENLKKLSGLLVETQEDYFEEQINLVSLEKRERLFPLFCQAILDLQLFVAGTVSYSCIDKQPHFFVNKLEIRHWLHPEQEGDDSNDRN